MNKDDTDVWAVALPATGRTLTPQLVGRDRELALLHRLIGSAQRPQLVEVVGDPGIGKTRLLTEVRALSAAHSYTVFAGRSAEFEQEVPFGVFTEALIDPLSALGAEQLDQLGEDAVDLLATAFTAPLGRSAEARADLVGMDRYRLYRAVRALLEVSAGRAGVTLVLDDVHWADAGSVELLDYLLRHPPRVPFLLAVGYRPRQASPRLLAALARGTESASLRLDLAPLTLAETSELLGADVSRPRRQQLFEASGGNPFYLDALARASARAHAATPSTSGLLPEVNGAVRMALAAELGTLTDQDLLVAQAAAVSGDPFDPELIAHVAELPVDSTMAALDELTARDLVRPEDNCRRFRYRHPLVRSAAYQTAPAAWRLGAHARAADGLERRGASALVRAHHVERAAHVGDAKAIAVLMEAAEAAFATVPTLAGHWLQTAMSLLPEGPEGVQRRLGLMLLHARALMVTGQFVESRETLHDLLRLLPAGPSELRRMTVSMCGAVERLHGRYDEARALLLAELERLDDQEGVLAASMRIELASGELQCAHFDDARSWAERALTCDALPPLLTAVVHSILATTNGYRGRFVEALDSLERAQAALDGLSDGELAERLYFTLEVAWAEMVLERYDDALRHIRRGMSVATRIGQGHMHADLLLAMTAVYTALGRLTDAAECAEATAEHALLLGREPIREVILGRQSEIALLTGDYKAALRFGEQAAAASSPGKYWWSGIGIAALATARLAGGDAERCIQDFERSGGPERLAYAASFRRMWHDVLVQAELGRGRVDAALEWAERGEAAVANGDLPGRTAQALLAGARARLAADDAQGAADRAERSAEAFAAVRLPLFEGQARQVLGAALDALGKAEAAAEQFGQAKSLFAGCGARGLHASVVQEQRTRGARRPRVRGGETGAPAALTGRQREIAVLVGQGCTNRQVAERLFMSPKTVEAHLSQIFTRLGINSRAALASHLARMERGPD